MPVAKPKEVDKEELQRYKEHAYKNVLVKLYNTAKKQLASYQTTVNGDNPHYHYFEIDSEGNGTTHGTINTGVDMQESDPHDHNIRKWVVSSAKSHIHAIDVVMKAGKRGRPKKVHANAPSRAKFKNFEEYHKAMKKYFKKPTRRPMAKGTHLTKSYLEKVVSRVLKMMVDKQGKPVGSISEWKGGRYKKVAPGKWVKVPSKEKGKPEPEAEAKLKGEPEEGEISGEVEQSFNDMEITLREENIKSLDLENIAEMAEQGITDDDLDRAIEQFRANDINPNGLEPMEIMNAAESFKNLREQEEGAEEPEAKPGGGTTEELTTNILSETLELDSLSDGDKISDVMEEIRRETNPSDKLDILDGLLGSIDDFEFEDVTVDSPINQMLQDLWESIDAERRTT